MLTTNDVQTAKEYIDLYNDIRKQLELSKSLGLYEKIEVLAAAIKIGSKDYGTSDTYLKSNMQLLDHISWYLEQCLKDKLITIEKVLNAYNIDVNKKEILS